MPCTTVREQLHSLSDGERLANWRETAAVLSHCVRCAECRAYFGQLRRLRHATRCLPQTSAVPAALRRRTLAHTLPLPNENPVTVPTTQPRPAKLTGERKKRMNRVTIATIALVVPIVVVTLATQKQRKPAPATPAHTSVKQQPSDTESQRPDEPGNAAFRERLQELRVKWQFWVREHQEDVAAMLRETGNERAAFDRVLSAMPPNLTNNTALTEEDLDAPGFPFDYIPFHRVRNERIRIRPNNTEVLILKDGDEETHAKWKAQQEWDEKYPKTVGYSSPESGRERFRDIEIVTTMKSGNSYSLWISGRITEKVGNTVTRNGLVMPFFEDYQDVAPPYPFLTQ